MKIGLFYSFGPHFLKAIHFLVEQYPNGNIIIFVPEKFPSYYFEELPVKPIFLPWNGEHLSLTKGISIFLKVIKIIRSQQLDILVTLFESPRQIILSRLSGARETYVYTIHKEYKTISEGIINSLMESFCKRVKGIFTYTYIFLHIYLCKTHKKD